MPGGAGSQYERPKSHEYQSVQISTGQCKPVRRVGVNLGVAAGAHVREWVFAVPRTLVGSVPPLAVGDLGPMHLATFSKAN